MLEMSQRNNLALEKINEAGHQFSPSFKPKQWDNEFKQKSSQYRDSLPKNILAGNGQYGYNQSARSSISNPFNKGKLVEQKKSDPNAVK